MRSDDGAPPFGDDNDNPIIAFNGNDTLAAAQLTEPPALTPVDLQSDADVVRVDAVSIDFDRIQAGAHTSFGAV